MDGPVLRIMFWSFGGFMSFIIVFEAMLLNIKSDIALGCKNPFIMNTAHTCSITFCSRYTKESPDKSTPLQIVSRYLFKKICSRPCGSARIFGALTHASNDTLIELYSATYLYC